jgi:hypothetical protein
MRADQLPHLADGGHAKTPHRRALTAPRDGHLKTVGRPRFLFYVQHAPDGASTSSALPSEIDVCLRHTTEPMGDEPIFLRKNGEKYLRSTTSSIPTGTPPRYAV